MLVVVYLQNVHSNEHRVELSPLQAVFFLNGPLCVCPLSTHMMSQPDAEVLALRLQAAEDAG